MGHSNLFKLCSRLDESKFLTVGFENDIAVNVGAVYLDPLCLESFDDLIVGMTVGVALSAGDDRNVGVNSI